MALETFVQEFASEMELDGSLPLENSGTYVLPLEDDVKVLIASVPEGFSLACTLAPCPQANKEAFLTKALLGNLFGQGTRGAVLGLNEAGNMVTLSKIIDGSVDYKTFKEALEDFVNTVDFWRGEAKT